jgi:transglutaminase-like putative cysteine protease
MSRPVIALAALALLVGAFALRFTSPSEGSRRFRCTYHAEITGLPPGETVYLWVPVPPSNAEQDVVPLERTVPAGATEADEPKYGNRILHVAAPAPADGTLALDLSYRVTRRVARADLAEHPDADFERFTRPDRLVPVGGRAERLLDGKQLPTDGLGLGRALFDVTGTTLRYDKSGDGWGRGDVEWACDSRRGNCSDFHSVFIALARGRGLPATFEVGFALPPARGEGVVTGYHCWAKFRPTGRGWVPVDVSEASMHPERREDYFARLDADRVTISVGRDLVLVPPQAGPPINFLVFPYVEVGGEPWSGAKVRVELRYCDEAGR